MLGIVDWTVDECLGGQPQVMDLGTNIVCVSPLLLQKQILELYRRL